MTTGKPWIWMDGFIAKPPPLYPEEYASAAKSILAQDLHLEKCDITPNNANSVHLHLLSKFSV